MYELTLIDADGADWFREFPTRLDAIEYLHMAARHLGLIVMDSGVYAGTEYIGPWRVTEMAR